MFNVKQSPWPEIDACFQPELLKGFEDNSFGLDIQAPAEMIWYGQWPAILFTANGPLLPGCLDVSFNEVQTFVYLCNVQISIDFCEDRKLNT